MTRRIELSPRLRLAADLVPEGARLADVGTDHAYLPACLLMEGKIPSAIAADLREGPLSRARETAAEYGCGDRMAFRLCDGLSAIAPDEADTLVIAGMGGETIIHILESAPWTRGCTLLLQPQTKIELLRAWLREHGYAADAERLVEDKGKLYLVLSVRGAEPGTASVLEQYGGFCLEGDPLYGAYLTRQIARLRRRAEGIRESRGEETQALLSLAAQLEEKKEVWQYGGRA